MSVYVDPLYEHGGSKTFKWKVSCHMFADTLEELHADLKAGGLPLVFQSCDAGKYCEETVAG